MSFMRALNISGSALTAQRLRLDIVSENISNMDTTRTENGGPYRRKVVQFQAVNDGQFKTALGVAINRVINKNMNRNALPRFEHETLRESKRREAFAHKATDGGVWVSDVIEDETPFKTIYDPTHPDANEYGYVELPNVELIKEVVDAMSASRSYEANVTAINAIKLMASKALEVGK